MKSSATVAPMAIGELAAHYGLAPHVLRHWEAMGLLSPGRDSAGRRRYDGTHLARVAVILRGKEAGLGLAEIRDLLADDGADRRRVRLEAHRQRLQETVDRARACLELVECALGCTHASLATCPDFAVLVQERVDAGPLPE